MNVVRFLHWNNENGLPAVFYGRPESQMFREAGRLGILVRPLNSTLKTGDLVNAFRLSRMLRADGINRLVVHQSQDLFVGAVARRLSSGGLRFIYSQHMHIGRDKKDWFHRWLYGQVDAVATPVQWLADRVMEKTSIPRDRIHVVPRGIEMDRFTLAQPDRAAARERLRLPKDKLVLGVVGRLDPKKCQDTVVRALKIVHDAGHEAHLLLMGNQTFSEGDEYVMRVQALIRELAMGEFVHLRPHQDDVEWAYAALDIFVLASKSEAYGMVTIEAMSSGLPVIGTADGGTLSLITPGETGLLVPPQDERKLADAILALVRDKDLAARLGRRARREALERFPHTRQVEAWKRLLIGL